MVWIYAAVAGCFAAILITTWAGCVGTDQICVALLDNPYRWLKFPGMQGACLGLAVAGIWRSRAN